MSKYLVGDAVKHWREQAEMSMEELADGIMDSSSLWKIENGKQMPTKNNIEALFEKLGVNPNNLATIFLDKQLAEMQELADNLDNALVTRNTNVASQIITQLEHNREFNKNKHNKQYLLAAKASLAALGGEEPKKVLDMLYVAFKAQGLNLMKVK